MSIDQEKYNSVATKGEVASVAIQATIGIRAILSALRTLKQGGTLDEKQLSLIEYSADELSQRFNELTGWTNEQR